MANENSDSVSILKNNGDGTFQTKVNYPAGDCPYSLFCADLDGDSDLDLAVANAYSNNVSILKNNGDGTFEVPVNYDAGDGSRSIFCGDLDEDGDLDLAVANCWSNNVSILKNNGDGTFQSAVSYAVGTCPASVFCADLDADGDLDLAVANAGSDNISILINLTHSRSYSLLFPSNNDSVKTPVTFNWRPSIDPDPNDTVRYDLYLSRSIVFNPESTVVYDSLLDTTFTDTLDCKTWYWKVRAYDKWGTERWSDQTDWSFYVFLGGDVNADCIIGLADVVCLARYILIGDCIPVPLKSGDVNCDGKYDLVDVILLARYVLLGQPFPC